MNSVIGLISKEKPSSKAFAVKNMSGRELKRAELILAMAD